MKPKYAILAGFLLFATVMVVANESTSEPKGQISFIMEDGAIYTPAADPLADLRAELDAMADRIEELEGLLEYRYITKRQDVFVRILDAASIKTNMIATESIQQSSMPLIIRQVNGHGSVIIHHGLVYIPEMLLAETLIVRESLTVGETEFPEDLPARVLALEVEIKALKPDSGDKERLPRRSRQER